MAKSKPRKKIVKQSFKKTKELNFLHSGNIEDIIYSLPFIISKGGGNIYIKDRKFNSTEEGGQISLIKRFLEKQPYIKKVLEYPEEYGDKHSDINNYNIQKDNLLQMLIYPVIYSPDIKIDFDLDSFRLSPYLFKEHLITSYFTYFESKPKLKLPFININNQSIFCKNNYIIFSVTNNEYDWSKVVEDSRNKLKYFVGDEGECNKFSEKYNCKIKYIKTEDIYELAMLIKDCERIYCTKSTSLSLAIALNKPYILNSEDNYIHTKLTIETILT